MNKRNLTIAALVAIVALAAVPILHAQQGRMHGAHAFGGFAFLGRLQHMKSALNLSDQQTDAIAAIAKDFHQQNAQYRQQLHGGLKAVAQALINNPNDIAGAQALLDQQSAAEKAMKSNALVAASKALNVLTPDQRAKLGEFVANHEARER
jgi:Spy/CpxP family protein refolding chaperone